MKYYILNQLRYRIKPSGVVEMLSDRGKWIDSILFVDEDSLVKAGAKLEK